LVPGCLVPSGSRGGGRHSPWASFEPLVILSCSAVLLGFELLGCCCCCWACDKRGEEERVMREERGKEGSVVEESRSTHMLSAWSDVIFIFAVVFIPIFVFVAVPII
jgi:hypothetical protein